MGALVQLATSTWPELEALAQGERTLGLVPIAAMEQHGPHLPYATDLLIAEELSRRVALRIAAPVVMAPVLPGGLSDMHLEFPGTVTVSERLLGEAVAANVAALASAGVRDVAVFSAHGGNYPFLARLAQERRDADGPRVIAHSAIERYVEAMFAGARKGGLQPRRSDQHAGGVETSQLLASHPQLVRPFGDVEGYASDDPDIRATIAASTLRTLTPSGVLGDVTHATAQAGERIYDAIADELAGWIAHELSFALSEQAEVGSDV